VKGKGKEKKGKRVQNFSCEREEEAENRNLGKKMKKKTPSKDFQNRKGRQNQVGIVHEPQAKKGTPQNAAAPGGGEKFAHNEPRH